MTLVDAGPLVAVMDRADDQHALCIQTLSTLTAPLVTTWPAFTEAMYVLGDRTGWSGQERLWRIVLRGDLQLAPTEALLERTSALMEKYRETPMDLADATLVALAEERRIRRIFTIDDDFGVY